MYVYQSIIIDFQSKVSFDGIQLNAYNNYAHVSLLDDTYHVHELARKLSTDECWQLQEIRQKSVGRGIYDSQYARKSIP